MKRNVGLPVGIESLEEIRQGTNITMSIKTKLIEQLFDSLGKSQPIYASAPFLVKLSI